MSFPALSKLLYYLPILLICILIRLNLPGLLTASGNLESVTDYASVMTSQAVGVVHTLSFTLPRSSEQIYIDDYIIINMEEFTNINANIRVSGAYTGTATAEVNGQNIIITGIAVLPGHKVIIEGITADNPVNTNQMKLIITVTEDIEGNIIKNIGSVYSSKASGRISVTATIIPPYASVVISGNSAPGTFITITENRTVIGTDTAGVGGAFNKYLTGLSPGTHTFTIYGVDMSSRTTSLLDVTAITPIYQETTISDLLLSPTIEISSAVVNQDDDLISWGSAIIDGDISIFTEPHLRTYYTSATELGNWAYTLDNIAEYIPGDYHIYSLVQNDLGSQSLFSNALQFTVESDISGGGGEACGDISRGDLNCDDSTNLIDFSILMYYWGSTNTTADIVSDSIVNLYDFSVMMYYWGT